LTIEPLETDESSIKDGQREGKLYLYKYERALELISSMKSGFPMIFDLYPTTGRKTTPQPLIA
jgi:hypothetical protein